MKKQGRPRTGKRGRPVPSPLQVPVGAEPEGLVATMKEYVDWMAVRQYSETTRHTRAQSLAHFAAWCEERSVLRPAEVTRPIVERYQR